jgi:signal transduction histidine kinase
VAEQIPYGAARDLLELLTTSDRLSELLPALHTHAVAAVGGRAAILFQFDRQRDWLQATSGFAVSELPTQPWRGHAFPPPIFQDPTPLFIPDLQHAVPGLAEYLGSSSAVLVPLAQRQEAIGVLVVASAEPSVEQMQNVTTVGHAFVVALERTRSSGDAGLQRDLRALVQEFSRAITSSLNMTPGLEALCAGASRLFAANRTSVWLHDRRERVVFLAASSDVEYMAQGRRVPTADAFEPAAVGLRRETAELEPHRGTGASATTGRLTIPLKGRRRALGTLVIDDVRLEPRGELELLDRAAEMGRQLSGAIENVLLLDAVLRSRRELDNTFNSLADLVAVTDRDGRAVNVNRAFVNRVGRPRENILDRPLSEAVGEPTRELLQKGTRIAPAPGAEDRKPPDPVTAEIHDPVLKGTFLITLTPLVGQEQQAMGAVLVARDITPHAQLEAERSELRNRLVQSEKLAALGQFVAGIAHELNNPLQGVLGHIELLRATGAFPKDIRRDMQRIYREADRAAKIVRNLLVFAGSRRLVRRRTSVNATLSRVLALRAPAFRTCNIEVTRRHDEKLPRIKGDPLLLQQAFLNIVLNAEQAIGAGGGRIETRTAFREDGRHGRGSVQVEIRDTGPGIRPEALSRVFEPFYTTKEVGKGTGLGLAITYGIIQEHGGQIIVSNHPEGGAVFTVQLPVEPG